MKLRTIWTLPCMRFKDRMKYTREELAGAIAARLPLRIRYWVTMQMMAKAATTLEQHDAAVRLASVMDRPKEVY